MTQFILHGSGMSFSQSGIQMAREIADNVPNDEIRCLSIGFAAGNNDDDRQWNQIQGYLAQDTKHVLKWMNPHKDVIVVPATLERAVFINQVRWANVIYAHGGDGDKLQERIPKYKGFKEDVLMRSVVAGGSAGTNMWVKSYFSNDNNRVCRGLDIVPIHTFCHYDTSKWQKLNQLMQISQGRPVIPIADDDFITYESR